MKQAQTYTLDSPRAARDADVAALDSLAHMCSDLAFVLKNSHRLARLNLLTYTQEQDFRKVAQSAGQFYASVREDLL